MPTPKHTRPGGRAARVREATLVAALAELAQGGYHALTFEGVARRAGIHKTTLYRRWGTREALILDAVRTRAVTRVPIPDTGSLREDLITLVHSAIDNLTSTEMEALVRTTVALSSTDDEIRRVGQTFWAERLTLDGLIVERAIARGEVTPVDPEQVIEAVLGPAYMRVLVTGRPVTDEFIANTIDHVVTGLPRPSAS